MDKRAFFRQAGVMLLMAAGLIGERPSQAADSLTVSVLVIYHSATGNTEKMAQGLAEGAKAVSGSSVVLKRVGDVIRDDLLSADAVIVGSPVYAGSISGQVKTFLDNRHFLTTGGPSSVLKLDRKICSTRSGLRL